MVFIGYEAVINHCFSIFIFKQPLLPCSFQSSTTLFQYTRLYKPNFWLLISSFLIDSHMWKIYNITTIFSDHSLAYAIFYLYPSMCQKVESPFFFQLHFPNSNGHPQCFNFKKVWFLLGSCWESIISEHLKCLFLLKCFLYSSSGSSSSYRVTSTVCTHSSTYCETLQRVSWLEE